MEREREANKKVQQQEKNSVCVCLTLWVRVFRSRGKSESRRFAAEPEKCWNSSIRGALNFRETGKDCKGAAIQEDQRRQNQ